MQAAMCESENVSRSAMSDSLLPHQAPLSTAFSRQEYLSE